MFVVITTRLLKTNTGAREQFAPRTANQTRFFVSGPFDSIKTARRAALATLAVHTCLDAQVWSAAQVQEAKARGYGRNGAGLQDAMETAARLLAAQAQLS